MFVTQIQESTIKSAKSKQRECDKRIRLLIETTSRPLAAKNINNPWPVYLICFSPSYRWPAGPGCDRGKCRWFVLCFLCRLTTSSDYSSTTHHRHHRCFRHSRHVPSSFAMVNNNDQPRQHLPTHNTKTPPKKTPSCWLYLLPIGPELIPIINNKACQPPGSQGH